MRGEFAVSVRRSACARDAAAGMRRIGALDDHDAEGGFAAALRASAEQRDGERESEGGACVHPRSRTARDGSQTVLARRRAVVHRINVLQLIGRILPISARPQARPARRSRSQPGAGAAHFVASRARRPRECLGSNGEFPHHGETPCFASIPASLSPSRSSPPPRSPTRSRTLPRPDGPAWPAARTSRSSVAGAEATVVLGNEKRVLKKQESVKGSSYSRRHAGPEDARPRPGAQRRAGRRVRPGDDADALHARRGLDATSTFRA